VLKHLQGTFNWVNCSEACLVSETLREEKQVFETGNFRRKRSIES